MANKSIKTLNAQSYSCDYEMTVNGKVISGTLNANGKKELNGIYGSVNEGDKQLANFNAYRNGEESPITSARFTTSRSFPPLSPPSRKPSLQSRKNSKRSL